MKRKFLSILIIFLISAFNSTALYRQSTELSYEHLAGNTYRFNLRIYSECPSNPAINSTYSLRYWSASLNVDSSFNVYAYDTSIMSYPCLNNYNCLSTTLLNATRFYLIEYEATLTLSGSATDWHFFFSNCCRNPGIINIGTNSATIYTTLDNSNVFGNNSVVLSKQIPIVINSNISDTIDINPIDIDGDSLDIYLSTPLNNISSFPNLPIPYPFNPGYTQTNPIDGNIILNPTTGQMIFTNIVYIGTYVIAYTIDEYRNGVKIASNKFDITFETEPINNNRPRLSNANNSIYTINICPIGGTINIPLATQDIDVTDSTFLWWDQSIPNAILSITPAQNESGVFSWTPLQADIRNKPYLVTFGAYDNRCPGSAYSTYSFQIYVNQCNTDSVWAGDANADFICNNYDALAIGIANGSSGPLRPSATTNWQAEWCPVWVDTFISSINYKHADCNGDGTVDATDLTAVSTNYGQIHFKQGNIGQYKTAGLPDLRANSIGINAYRGSTISIPIELGTTGSTMDNMYGISATVELINAQTSAPISISNTNSWIGDNTNMFTFEKSLAANKTAFTLVRNNQQAIAAGQGQIGTIEFPIAMSSVIGSQVIVQFSDIKIIKSNGEEIMDYNVLQDTITILVPQSVSDLGKETQVSIYPNPVQKELNIKLTLTESDTYQATIYDQVGRIVKENVINEKLTVGEHHLSIDISSLPSSMYFLKIKNSSGSETFSFGKY